MIRAIQAMTVRPFNVNVSCHPPAVADDVGEAAWLARLAPTNADEARAMITSARPR